MICGGCDWFIAGVLHCNCARRGQFNAIARTFEIEDSKWGNKLWEKQFDVICSVNEQTAHRMICIVCYL